MSSIANSVSEDYFPRAQFSPTHPSHQGKTFIFRAGENDHAPGITKKDLWVHQDAADGTGEYPSNLEVSGEMMVQGLVLLTRIVDRFADEAWGNLAWSRAF